MTTALEFTNYILNPHAIPFLVVGVLILVLGVLLLLENVRSSIRLAFYVLCLSVSWWLISFSIAYSTTDPSAPLFWHKISMIGVLFIAPSAYAFTITALT